MADCFTLLHMPMTSSMWVSNDSISAPLHRRRKKERKTEMERMMMLLSVINTWYGMVNKIFIHNIVNKVRGFCIELHRSWHLLAKKASNFSTSASPTTSKQPKHIKTLLEFVVIFICLFLKSLHSFFCERSVFLFNSFSFVSIPSLPFSWMYFTRFSPSIAPLRTNSFEQLFSILFA